MHAAAKVTYFRYILPMQYSLSDLSMGLSATFYYVYELTR